MRWKTATPPCLGALLLASSAACAQPAPPQPARYDPAPLLASLRPWARQALPAAAHLQRLDQLPLYSLTVSLAAGERAFSVAEELWFTNNERVAMPEVVLRVYANAARREHGEPPVRFVTGRCVTTTCAVRQESPSVIVVRPRAPLAPGASLRVLVELQGALSEIDSSRTNILSQGMESLSMLGAGESSGDYGLLATGDGVVSMANFYAVVGRRVGGRWERNDGGHAGDLGSDDLANVRAILDFPASHTVATTGVTLGRTVANDRQRLEVGAAAVRDFCVMAGATLRTATRRVGEVDVRSHYLPADQAAGERVLDVAAAALEDYERRFGPYPYVDLDIVEAPLVGGAGGVEFPGLVTVASMFYKPPQMGGLTGGLMNLLGMGSATDAMGQMMPAMLEFVTAHEVAHQYWHGLVGSDSRLHPFVDESLAQWSAALYLEDRYGAERARRDADMNVRMNYQMMRMMGRPDGAVDRPAASFGDPLRYAGIVYGKGPYLYNALREAAGDAVFFRAVRRYVDTWRFRTAPPTGFVDALVAEHGAGAARYRSLARRWLQESHGDDDLGQANMASLLQGVMGGNATPEMQQAIEMLGPMLQGMTGGAAPTPTPNGAAGPQRIPSGAAPGAGGASELQGAMEELMRQLDTQ